MLTHVTAYDDFGELWRSYPEVAIVTVLVVDRDLGFLFWLGCVLSEAGHDALPARNVKAASLLLRSLNSAVELLVVDSGLPGAQRFAAQLRRLNPEIKVIDALAAGSRLGGEISRLEWLRVCGCAAPERALAAPTGASMSG